MRHGHGGAGYAPRAGFALAHACALLLFAPAGDHARIHVQGDAFDRQLREEPAVNLLLNPATSGQIKTLKQSDHGAVPGTFRPAEHARKDAVAAGAGLRGGLGPGPLISSCEKRLAPHHSLTRNCSMSMTGAKPRLEPGGGNDQRPAAARKPIALSMRCMSAKPPQALTALPLKCRDDSVAVALMV